MGKHSLSPTPGSWLGDTPHATDVPALHALPTQEDAHVALLDQLAEGDDAYVVDFGDRHIGLVVGGQLRATYRAETVYPEGSTTARYIMAAAQRKAARAAYAVRSFNRAVTSAVPRGVAEEPADWEPQEFTTPDAPVLATQTFPVTPVEPEEPFDIPERAQTRVIDDETVDPVPAFLRDIQVSGLYRPPTRTIVEGDE